MASKVFCVPDGLMKKTEGVHKIIGMSFNIKKNGRKYTMYKNNIHSLINIYSVGNKLDQ